MYFTTKVKFQGTTATGFLRTEIITELTRRFEIFTEDRSIDSCPLTMIIWMQPLIRKECSSSVVRKVCRGNCVSTIIITLLQNYFFLKIGGARSRGTLSEVVSMQPKELSTFSLTCLQISIACPLVRDVGYHCSFFSYEKTVHPLNKFLGELLQSTIYTVLLI